MLVSLMSLWVNRAQLGGSSVPHDVCWTCSLRGSTGLESQMTYSHGWQLVLAVG